MLFFFLDCTITEALSHHGSQRRPSFNPRPSRFLFKYFVLPLSLSCYQFFFLILNLCTVSAIWSQHLTASLNSSSPPPPPPLLLLYLLITLVIVLFKKLFLLVSFFFILHFAIIHTLLATLFHPFYLHGPSVLPVCNELFTCVIVHLFLKYVLFNLCNKFFAAEHKIYFNCCSVCSFIGYVTFLSLQSVFLV
jgi:hypothetical protein